MRKITKGLCALALSIVVLVSLLSGCGSTTAGNQPTTSPTTNKTAATSETLPPVNLTMYLVGDKPADTDTVLAEVNKKLQEKINTTITLNMISWGDLDTKYPLIFASGEDFDMAYTSNWCKYVQEATKQGFLELTPDMLQKYAPKTYADEPQVAWDQAKVDGKIYMVPQNSVEYNTFCIVYRGDLQEKYGIGDIKTVDDYTKYLDAVSKNEQGMSAVSPQYLYMPLFFQPHQWVNLWGDFVTYDLTDTSYKAFSVIDTQDYMDYAKQVKGFADKGYWSKSIAGDQTPVEDLMSAGKIASFVRNAKTSAADVIKFNQSNQDWKVNFVDLSPNAKRYVNLYISNGMAIHQTSKNPERALMALDLLRNDPEIHDLTQLGIEGQHWTASGDNQYTTGPDAAKYPAGALDSWGWNSSIDRISVDTPQLYTDYLNNWVKNATVHTPLEMLTFNDTNVKNEIAACTNVYQTYEQQILAGEAGDPEKALAAFRDQFKTAGIDKIVAEAQSQIDATVQAGK